MVNEQAVFPAVIIRNRSIMLKNSRSLGIVIELENIESSGEERTFANLAELQRQIEQIDEHIPGQITLKIVFDSNLFSQAEAEEFITRTGIDRNPKIAAQAIGAPGIHYYQHKDIGAQHCDNDIILFMDSDILIQPGWLQSMIGAFDEDVNFVCGVTYIETPTFLNKVYALTTEGFRLEQPATKGLEPVPNITANAFAYRASKVDGPIFPTIDAYRGHCVIASRNLASKGETIYAQREAIARHPSEDTFKELYSRAFTEGCDIIFHARYNNRPGWRGVVGRSIIGSVHRLARALWGVTTRCLTQYDKVGLPVLAIPPAIMLGGAFHTIRFVGEVTTLVSTPLARSLSLAKAG